MSDGLIFDEDRTRQSTAPTSQIPNTNANRAAYNSSPQPQNPPPGYQAAFYGAPNPQGGIPPSAMTYSPANQSNYAVSPLQTPAPGQMSGYSQAPSSYVVSPPQTPQPQPGQHAGYLGGYQQPLPQYGQAPQAGYSNNAQPQPQYDPDYQEFLLWKQQRQQQQPHQNMQPGQAPYLAPQQQNQMVYPPPPLYGGSDEKQVALPPSSTPEASASKRVLPYQHGPAPIQRPLYQPNQQVSPYQAAPQNQQIAPYPPASTPQQPPLYQPPPSSLGPEILNVPFKPITLHGEDQHHAVKQMIKAGGAAVVLSAILGTYLYHKRQKEQQRLSQSFFNDSTTHSTEQVAMYNHLMDKLESLSGNVLTEHGHKVSAAPWQEALHPHRRAIFADLYNSNENVRGFCDDFPGGPTAFPQMDEYSLGMRKPRLSFQRAGRQAPNWNAARDLLGQVRTVILLDDSGSMGSPGHAAWDNNSGSDGYGYGGSSRGSKSRWNQAHELIAGIAPLVSRYNRHGIDIHFLNHQGSFLGLHSSQDINRVFQTVHPGGGTPTGRRVNEILDGYMCVLRYNRSLQPLNLIVVTDGEAQDEGLLHRAIEEHVTKIVHRGFQAHQFGVEFLQVGDDWEATKHLERLEEQVSRHHHAFQRDVVGVTPASRQRSMTPDKLLGIVVSGIDARMNGYMRHRGVDV